jgi:hypothetical protein
LQVPIVPLDWLQELVRKGECDFSSGHARKLRAWVYGIDQQTVGAPCQFMPYSTSGMGQSRRNVSPYITSPYTETGNVKDSSISDMLRADNVTGTMDYSIAANMLKNTEIKNFFHASNIDCEVNNLIPALLTHSNKVCNFDALFNMAPVVNVKFFLGLIFTEVELRQLSEGLFYHTSDDRPTTGAFQRLEKQPMRNGEEAGNPWTAYGVHIVVILVLAAFLGENMSNSCDCAAEVASTITKSLMQQAPPAMLHPSGTATHPSRVTLTLWLCSGCAIATFE